MYHVSLQFRPRTHTHTQTRINTSAQTHTHKHSHTLISIRIQLISIDLWLSWYKQHGIKHVVQVTWCMPRGTSHVFSI